MPRKQGYKTDLTDDEWYFTAPYLAIIPLDAVQRKYDAREVLNAIRYVVKTGVQWDFLPNEFLPPEIVKDQLKRWIDR
jgi:transposase